MVSTAVQKEIKDNLYLAFYTFKGTASPPKKVYFKASSGMKALRKLCKQCGIKNMEGFKTLALMEVYPNNTYRDVVSYDSQISAKTVMAGTAGSTIGATVTDLGDFKRRKGERIMGKGSKKHVKLGWVSQKIVVTQEKRILDGMKLLQEKDYTQQEVKDFSRSNPSYPNRTYTPSGSGMTAGSTDEDRLNDYYARHYSGGYDMMGDDY